VVLLLDEFDDLDQKVRAGILDAEALSQFRNLIQHSENVSVVLCGTHRLEELAAEHWSFLLNLAVYGRIGLLDWPDAADAIRVPLAQLGFICGEAAVDRAVWLAGRHPYLLQLLGYRLVEELTESGDETIGVEQLERASVDVIVQGEIHLQYLWQMAGDPGRQVMRALLSAEDRLTAHEISRATDIDRRLLSRALRELTAADIVTEDAGRFAAGIGLLSRWIDYGGWR
jgi:DNA-binding transcriptional ArsR family regulator